MDPRNPSEVGLVFSKNLRRLVQDRASVSQVCRELKINRTQFNRYLTGDTHPRPDILDRICRYFEVDARVLLEPLDEIAPVAPSSAESIPQPGGDPFGQLRQGFDHQRMPDGIYQFIMPNMIDPPHLVADLIRLSTGPDDCKRMHWSVPRFLAEANGQATAWHARKLEGQVFQHSDGVSLVIANPYARLMMHWFLTPGYRGASRVHTGYATMSQETRAGQIQIAPLILRQLPPDCASILAARRAQADISLETLPDKLASYLTSWSPSTVSLP